MPTPRGIFPATVVDLPCRCQFIFTLAVTLSLPFIDSQLCSSAPFPSNPAVIGKGRCVDSLLLCCQCWCPLLRYLLALAFGWRPNEQPVRRPNSWRREEIMSGKSYSPPPGTQYSCSFYSWGNKGHRIWAFIFLDMVAPWTHSWIKEMWNVYLFIEMV